MVKNKQRYTTVTQLTTLLFFISLLVGGFWLGLGIFAQAARSATLVLNSVAPLPNSHHNLVTTTIVITYDQVISPTTVNSQTLIVQGQQTGLVRGDYQVDNLAASLTPDIPFKAGDLVQVSATQDILGLSGGTANFPASSLVWSFRTATQPSAGLFTSGEQPFPARDSHAISLVDVDGDNYLDVVILNSDSFEIWRNTLAQPGQFEIQQLTPFTLLGRGIALADADHDGDVDAFIGSGLNDPNQLWLNNGAGTFAVSGQTFGDTNAKGLALGDLNSDGWLDLFTANDGQANTIWLNQKGIFTSTGQILTSANSRAVALGDLDGDYDLDAFVVNDGPNTVWRNDGEATFTATTQTLGQANSLSLSLGDVDDDGDLDALVGNDANPAQVWLNNGQASFSLGQAISITANVEIIVQLGDLDGDGDLDIFMGSSGLNQAWFNDGSGSFSSGVQTLAQANTQALALGDVDDDGDLDVFNANNAANHLWLNAVPPLDLALQKRVVPTTTWAGQPVTYQLVFTNQGQFPVTNLLISDTFPTAVRPLQVSTPLTVSTSQTEQTIQWAISQLDAGQVGRITITAKITGPVFVGEELVNRASITSDEGELTGSDHLAQATTLIKAAPPIYLPLLMKGWPPIPGNITLATTQLDDNDYVLNWTRDDAQLAQTYHLQEASEATFASPITRYQGSARVFTITNRSPGTYYYRVKGIHSLGYEGPWSNIVPVEVLGAPAAVGLHLAEWFTNGAQLTWDGDSEATTYWLIEDVSPAFNEATIIYQGPDLAYTVPERNPLTDFKTPTGIYFYQVQPRNPFFIGDWSNTVSSLVFGGRDGLGEFELSSQPGFTLTIGTQAVALGDLNDSSYFDAIIVNYNGPTEIWFNIGPGLFFPGNNLPTTAGLNLALGDLDRDDDLDIFLARGAGDTSDDNKNQIWLNDGEGNFTRHQTINSTRDSFAVALGDLDHDGDLDAFVANHTQSNMVWFNDGNATFTDSGQRLGDAYSNDVALADLNGDGHLDAFVANGVLKNGSTVLSNASEHNAVWFNDGSGSFTRQEMNDPLRYSYAVALGDVDGDGDVDAFIGNMEAENEIWLNDSLGLFTSGPAMDDIQNTTDVVLDDVNGDGDLDAFVVNLSGVGLSRQNQVWRNDGEGQFSLGQTTGDEESTGVAVGDLDIDGDVDAFVVNDNEVNQIWFNLDD